MTTVEYPVLSFNTSLKWEEWLEKYHGKTPGVWLRFYKKASDVKSLTYNEALDVALCYGWIDSQVKKYDEKSYLQKFTPRRSKSIWSKINTTHIERLVREDRMKPAGLKQVQEAKKDGRWNNAYSSPKEMTIPEDFLIELKKNAKAFSFFQTLNKTNLYAIGWRLNTAKKPETRNRRIKVILTMLAKKERLY